MNCPHFDILTSYPYENDRNGKPCRRDAPGAGLMTSLVLPSANTAMTHLFLEQVSKSFENYCIVMQVDQAGWHRFNELLVPANIRLIERPSCSPEVNLVEHLWEELREEYLHNRLFLC